GRTGASAVAPELSGELSRQKDVPVGEEQRAAVDASLRDRLKAASGTFYMGESPNVPKVGDVRVSFRVVEPAPASIVAAQRSGRLEPYHAEAGGDIALVSYGNQSAEQMFQAARTANATLTWILRLVGFVLLFVGVRSLLRPLEVASDVVPLFGRLVGAGLSLAAFLVAAPVALLTIRLGWALPPRAAGGASSPWARGGPPPGRCRAPRCGRPPSSSSSG